MLAIKIRNSEVILPDYMNSLVQSVIDTVSKEKDCSSRIVSCGVNPNDGILYLVTGLPEVRHIIPNGDLRPKFSTPVNSGTELIVEFKDVEGYHSIYSRLAIAKSCSSHCNSKLHVNDTYVCDLSTIEFLE